jgi:excisionase family DNA binding protein
MQNPTDITKRIEELERELAELKATKAESENAPAYLTFSDVKKMLSLGDKLTRKLIRKGRIPVIRVGPRKCLFSKEAVIKAMNAMQEGGSR